jgi:hypothetical protein
MKYYTRYNAPQMVGYVLSSGTARATRKKTNLNYVRPKFVISMGFLSPDFDENVASPVPAFRLGAVFMSMFAILTGAKYGVSYYLVLRDFGPPLAHPLGPGENCFILPHPSFISEASSTTHFNTRDARHF